MRFMLSVFISVLLVFPFLAGSASAQSASFVPGKLVCEVTGWRSVWSDSGSGAGQDIEIWQPDRGDAIFLGMTATNLYDTPPRGFACDYRHSDPSLLATPVGWALGYNDSGTGSHRNVTIYVPICPAGFEQLGDVAIGGYLSVPQAAGLLSGFRCVKSSLIVGHQQPRQTWADHGSGGDIDVQLWTSEAFQKIAEDLNDARFDQVDHKNRLVVGQDYFWAQANYNNGPDRPGKVIDPANVRLRVARIEPAEMVALLNRHLPTLVFEPKEQFFLTRAEDLLSNMVPRNAQGAACDPSVRGPNNDLCWLELVDLNKRFGDLDRGVVYLNILRFDTVTRVQVWFLYAYNGPGAARMELDALGENLDLNLDLAPCGAHQGDWEHVTLEFTNHTKTLDRIYYSEHDGGRWEARNSDPVTVYASRNGHAAYAHPKDDYNAGGTVDIVGITVGGGLVNKVYHIGDVPRIAYDTRVSGRWQIINARDLTHNAVSGRHPMNPLARGKSMMHEFSTLPADWSPPWFANQVDWGKHTKSDRARVRKELALRIGQSLPAAEDSAILKLLYDESSLSVVDLLAKVAPEALDHCYDPEGPTPPWQKGNWNGNEG